LGCVVDDSAVTFKTVNKLETRITELEKELTLAKGDLRFYTGLTSQIISRLTPLEDRVRVIDERTKYGVSGCSELYVNMDIYDSDGKLVGHGASLDVDTAIKSLESYK
jgi:hypothetical protein